MMESDRDGTLRFLTKRQFPNSFDETVGNP